MDNQLFSYSSNSAQSSGSVVAPKVAPTPSLEAPKEKSPISLIIGLIVAIVFAVGFIILFIVFYTKYIEASTSLDAQIESAVATAVNEKAESMEKEFSEREKDPYKTFAGPADYGELSFSYPKTWSVYIAKDAANGGAYEAYFSPSEVAPITEQTPNSLRLSILDSSFESVAASYDSLVTKGSLSLQVVKINGQTANRYDGTFASGLKGSMIVLKIRDKTVVMRTDAEIFLEDFNKVIETINFNA